MNVTVYTALFGETPDQIRAAPDVPGVTYVAFTDQPELPKPWVRGGDVLYEAVLDPRRRARFHKCQPHVVLPGRQFTLWVDATHEILCNPAEYVHDMLEGEKYDFATFKHAERTCIYQEIRACLAYKKDVPAVMAEQLRRYELEGYPYYNGLCETSVVARRDTASTRTLGAMWWREIDNGSVRDQLSLPYVLWRLKRGYAYLDGTAHERPRGFRFHSHWERPCASAST